MFAGVLRANTDHERQDARSILLEKMNSLYEKDLKDHLYAVVRSTKIL
jgi:polyphosphate kinase